MPTITFMPSGKIVEVHAGTRLTDACRRAGFKIPAPCGEKGLCGKCRVRVMGGEIPVDERQRECLPPRLLNAGWRASCVVEQYGDLILADPIDNDAGGVILTDFMTRDARGGSGLWECDVVMPKPSTEDQRDDETRLREALAGEAKTAGETPALGHSLRTRLPRILREADFQCRAIGLGDRILALWDTRKAGLGARKLGLAVDVGTTTMAAALCDLDDSSVLAVASAANPQALRGDDVITRVDYASRGPAELAEMRQLAVRAIQDLCDAARREAGVTEQPLLVSVGANTVMNHLLLGVPPGALAQAPFIPAFRGPVAVSAADIGWEGDEPPLVHVLPNISAYVGGDITAGMLAHDIHRLDGKTLFLDVGTNGEIALAVDGVVYACATAAGPAFEGARIKQGMRAAPGAISKVGLTGDGMLEIGVVDSLRPARGICGTGLLDAVAVLLRAGVIDEGGRVLDAEEARENNPEIKEGLLAMAHEDEEGPAVWLERPGGRGNPGVSLTQRDVRELQLAKGAVAAGVKVLLNVAGLKPTDLDRVLLAGGFGNYLDPASALGIGMLPPEIDRNRVRSVGNASLAGTRLCLLSDEERNEAAELSRRVRYIELSGRDDFQAAFAEEMLFPERES